ncbi:MAG: hypothetical protein M5R36_22765 [Deltaproteobacteria bacterium]|nr:hypothetical protein [Deltaproteobacteria bacterium]
MSRWREAAKDLGHAAFWYVLILLLILFSAGGAAEYVYMRF